MRDGAIVIPVSALRRIFVMLLVLSWPLAIAAVLLSPLIVYVVREYYRLYGVPRNASR